MFIGAPAVSRLQKIKHYALNAMMRSMTANPMTLKKLSTGSGN